MTGCRTVAKVMKWHYEYMKGRTLSEVAKEHGVTKQAISFQFKRYGLPLNGGGIDKKREQANKARQLVLEAKRDKWSKAAFGIPFAESRAISRHLRDAYREQKRRANQRGIGWELNLLSWHEIWRNSGKLENRGRSKGEYVMGRRGDIGPYSKDNVYIITCSDNIKEVRERERIQKTTKIVAKKF